MHFILDAHNIIYNHPKLSVLMKTSIDSGQKSLLSYIEDYARKYKSYRFTLVFDGAASEVHSGFTKIKIIKSGKNKTADDIIKQLIRNEINHKLCSVVSSDTEIYNYARLCGCRALTSKEFINLLESLFNANSSNKSSDSEKPQNVTKNEIKEMLKEFSNENDFLLSD